MSEQQTPEHVLEELLEKKPRPQKCRSLIALNALCERNFESGGRDFSIALIGKLCEQQGVLKSRGLYNESAADHRRVIDAWAARAGPVPTKKPEALATDAYIDRIDDPAIRFLVHRVIAERNKLKAQLNTLKSATKIVVDRRVGEGDQLPFSGKVALTNSERDALRKVISPAFLSSNGWAEIEFGEIVNDRGRTIFDPGFATGLRKLLGD
ncbi:alpha/beta hydrolase [Roseateles sp. DAIF2]|uniref:gamma-mobile-trio protein GmtX n=1 Tax=Roseateles sp. DAIF2 TaxID=2714952 RepID=UPI0018A2AE4B|nr:gamma-mobile-trio protein GmtX [Roseateles sp. DAIF2]QPF72249.1 alpha/beta hydrolase [Roseateles sp. DAIF2]